nr:MULTISPECIES: hypothetical protein [Enterococcus]
MAPYEKTSRNSYYSIRINIKHRLVYSVDILREIVTILSV